VLKKFQSDDQGTVVIIFAFISLILFAVIGLAVDYGRHESVRAEAQSALDNALLSAAAQSRRQGADPIDLANKFFEENWSSKHQDAVVNINVVKGENGALTGSAVVSMPTTITQVAGFTKMKIDLSSSVQVGEGSVELVLALDTTGSMAGEKIDTLKTSSTDLVETLFDVSSSDERIKIGVVPFAQYVNVGEENRNAPWMSVGADETNTSENCYDKREVIGTSNCRTETATVSNDGVPYTYEYEICDYEYSDPTPVCEPMTTTTAWYGCAGSRFHPLNTQDQDYSDPVPGVMNVSCGAPALSLTGDKGSVIDALDGLVASGETYIPSGLVWGWRALSPDAPLTGGSAYGARNDGISVRKILVLMTDGVNTKSPSYPTHDGTEQAVSDSLTSELCTNIKSAGIEIYTVAFEVTDETTKSVLKSCATTTKNFFDATSSEELQTAFINIAKDVTPLRLAD